MVFIDDGLEGILKSLMGIIELLMLICKAQGALVLELQSDLDGDAGIGRHKGPLLIYIS